MARRLFALCTLTLVFFSLAIVPSCTDPGCADGGEGCPCSTPYECAHFVPDCHAWICDGTCHLLEGSAGDQCLLHPCDVPGACTVGHCSADLACVECVNEMATNNATPAKVAAIVFLIKSFIYFSI